MTASKAGSSGDRGRRASWTTLLLSRREKSFVDLSYRLTLSCRGGWKSKYLVKISCFIVIGSHQPWLIPWGRTLCSPFSIGLRTGLLLSVEREEGSCEGTKRVWHRYFLIFLLSEAFWKRIQDMSLASATIRDVKGVMGAGWVQWCCDAFLGKVTAMPEPEGPVRISQAKRMKANME